MPHGTAIRANLRQEHSGIDPFPEKIIIPLRWHLLFLSQTADIPRGVLAENECNK
jgi:hypothetical protein